MDNNNQTKAEQTNTQPETVEPTAFPTVAESTPQTAQPNVTEPAKKAPVMWMGIAVIILVLILTGGYLYLSMSQKSQISPVSQPVTKTAEDTLEAELNSLDVESDGNDFAEVDKDLQNL